jgi:diguanylate cyclase (GGDEF)-like protein/PAS domain S-box-containing protein
MASGMDADRGSALLTSTPDLVWFADAAGRLTEVNPAAARLLGWPDPAGRPMLSAFTVASRAVVEIEALPALRGTGRWSGDVSMRSAEGEAVPVSLVLVAERTGGGAIAWISGIARDLRTARSREDQLRREVTHDPLTGLPHRGAALRAAATAIAAHGGAVVLCDVDELRAVNDMLGQTAGDQVLVALAGRIRDAVRPGDIVGRVGDDEFVVVLPGTGLEDAIDRITAVHATLAEPYGIAGRTVRLTTSAGVADVPTGHYDPTTLLRDAGVALEAAKSGGKGRVERYDPSMQERIERRRQLATELEGALGRGELRLVYQPIVHLGSGEVRGVEALVRWQHPTFGSVSPEVFVPLLEHNGLIGEVGGWILATAVDQAGRWHRDPGMEALTVNVNVSARQIADDLPGFVAATLAGAGLPPELLKIELTESSLAWDAALAIDVLGRLRSMGVRIALDDFGTGYSSLARLQALPIDDLKIDRTFVQGMATAGDTGLVAAICTMASVLGAATVAEGIEEEEEARTMRDLGCDFGQGFLWSRPIEADEVAAEVSRIGSRGPTFAR